jgi:hypothetical protein
VVYKGSAKNASKGGRQKALANRWIMTLPMFENKQSAA